MFSRQWPSKRARHRSQQHHYQDLQRSSSTSHASHCRATGCGNGTGLSSTSALVMIAIIFYALLLYEGSAEIDSKYKQIPQYLDSNGKPDTGVGFDPSASKNVTGLVGTTVTLVCRIKNLGNRTVSWIRHRDIHLLTTGKYTYTSDQRFQSLHQEYSEDWILRIRFAQIRDSGTYECQVSTTPPVGHKVYLDIVEPITEIAGGADLFINKGSTINLTCLVKNAPGPPTSMIWSHNQQPINFDSPRGGISLVTEKGPITTSRLLIQKAIQKDSGLYTCAPTNGHPNSVRVHILNEEHPAAMHHGGGDRMAARLVLVVILVRMIF